MPFEREQLGFGQGSFVGPALNSADFYALDVRDQARVIGWTVGCPVVEQLTDPAHPDQQNRGPENMLGRYAEVGFWFGYTVRAANEVNQSLGTQLAAHVERRPGEPVGVHEPESVPVEYDLLIPPTETLVGYHLPRLLIKQFGTGEQPERFGGRVTVTLSRLGSATWQATSPYDLLAIFAESTPEQLMDRAEVLSSILSTGWYGEHHADHMVDAMKAALSVHAPHLWETYRKLTTADKQKAKIL